MVARFYLDCDVRVALEAWMEQWDAGTKRVRLPHSARAAELVYRWDLDQEPALLWRRSAEAPLSVLAAVPSTPSQEHIKTDSKFPLSSNS